MVRVIHARDAEGYLRYLSRLISLNTAGNGGRVLFIECMNRISQYIFRRSDLERVMEQLYVVRIEVVHDLVDMLLGLHLSDEFRQSRLLVLSSYSHLLEDERDREHLETRIMRVLKRLEDRHGKEVIVLGYRRKWDTQYRLNDMSSMRS